MSNERHIHDLLNEIEEGDETLHEEDLLTRPHNAGTVDYPGEYSDIARVRDEDARAGWRPTHIRTPHVNDDDDLETLTLAMQELGMPPGAARIAARGRHGSA